MFIGAGSQAGRQTEDEAGFVSANCDADSAARGNKAML